MVKIKKLKNMVFEKNFVNVIKKLMKNEDMPIIQGWRLVKLNNILDLNLKMYSDLKVILLEKYGEKNKDIIGTYNFPDKKKFFNYKKELGELLNQDFTVDVDKIKLPDTVKISAEGLVNLEPVLDIDNTQLSPKPEATPSKKDTEKSKK